MFVYVIYSSPVLQTCAQQVSEKVSSWNTLYWHRALSRNSLQFFFATKDLTGNSKLIYWILRAIPLTLHDGGNSTQRSSLRLLETEVVSSQLSRALNSLTSWKEPQDEHSVTLLVLPEKSLDTASTVRRLYTVQPLVKYSTLAVTISDGQDEVGIIWK